MSCHSRAAAKYRNTGTARGSIPLEDLQSPTTVFEPTTSSGRRSGKFPADAAFRLSPLPSPRFSIPKICWSPSPSFVSKLDTLISGKRDDRPSCSNVKRSSFLSVERSEKRENRVEVLQLFLSFFFFYSIVIKRITIRFCS